MISKWLISSRNIKWNSFFWNAAGCFLLAIQPTLFVALLTRLSSLEDAGIFTVANANSNLFLMIGKFGVRNFQVSDYTNLFCLRDYRNSRIFTCLLMAITSFTYIIIAGTCYHYSIYKMQVILWMCLFRTADAVEDYIIGTFQKIGRLDIAGRGMTLRIGFSIFLYSGILLITRDLLITLIINTVVTFFLLFLILRIEERNLHIIRNINKQEPLIVRNMNEFHESKRVGKLLFYCLPIFIGSFLSVYIMNIPKYSIDRILNDQDQAIYGFISMPVYIINILSSFILNPMMPSFSKLWGEGKIKSFKRLLRKQIFIIFLLTSLCLAMGYFAGIPVLSIFYHTDLHLYQTHLELLLLSGGFLALSETYSAILTIIRKQQLILISYGVICFISTILSDTVVLERGILGGSLLYLFSSFFLSCFMASFILYALRDPS